MTLMPAYGRDYTSKAAVRRDFDADKDFVVNEIGNRWDGKPANKSGLKTAGVESVTIRYARLTKVMFVKVG
jgi:hypothetical protein